MLPYFARQQRLVDLPKYIGQQAVGPVTSVGVKYAIQFCNADGLHASDRCIGEGTACPFANTDHMRRGVSPAFWGWRRFKRAGSGLGQLAKLPG